VVRRTGVSVECSEAVVVLCTNADANFTNWGGDDVGTNLAPEEVGFAARRYLLPNSSCFLTGGRRKDEGVLEIRAAGFEKAGSDADMFQIRVNVVVDRRHLDNRDPQRPFKGRTGESLGKVARTHQGPKSLIWNMSGYFKKAMPRD
jgi:hypothetical protein